MTIDRLSVSDRRRAASIVALLASCGALAFDADHGPMSPVMATSKDATPAINADLVDRFAGLRESARSGRGSDVLMVQTDRVPAVEEDLADELVRALDLPSGSTLAYDSAQSIVRGRTDDRRIRVFQHYHSGVRVEGSIVTVIERSDAATSVHDSLRSPVTTATSITSDDATARAKAAAALKTSKGVLVYRPGPRRTALPTYRFEGQDDPRIARIDVDASTGETVVVEHSIDRNGDLGWLTAPPALPTYTKGASFCTLDPPVVDTGTSGARTIVGQAYAPTAAAPSTPVVRLRNAETNTTVVSLPGVVLDYFVNNPVWTDWVDGIPAYYGCKQLPPVPHPTYPAGDTVTPMASALFWGAQQYRTTMESRFGRQGYDNANGPVALVADVSLPDAQCVHVSSALPITAMVACSNDWALPHATPEPSVEVPSHELTHALLRTAGLTFATTESRAIEEGFGDLFGEITEHDTLGANDWLVADAASSQLMINRGCDKGKPEFCGRTGIAFRVLSNPKGGIAQPLLGTPPLWPGPSTYLGDHWAQAQDFQRGQVISHAYFRMATGASGLIDDKPGNAAYEIQPISFDAMAGNAYDTLVSLVEGDDMSDLARHSADAMVAACGAHANETFAVKEAWFAANLGLSPGKPVDASHYLYPENGETDVPTIVTFKASIGEDLAYTDYAYQLATDPDFVGIVAQGTATMDPNGIVSFAKKLAPKTKFWWRIRPQDTAWGAQSAELCWRPTQTFESGLFAPVVSTGSPNDELVAPWAVNFSFAGVPDAAGYELMVDYREHPTHPAYLEPGTPVTPDAYDDRSKLLVLAHVEVSAAAGPNEGNSYGFDRPIPLPKKTELRWMVRPYFTIDGQRENGEWREFVFETDDAITTIITPAVMFGPNPGVSGQPLEIVFDPADHATHHDVTLKMTDVYAVDHFKLGILPATLGQISQDSQTIAASFDADHFTIKEPAPGEPPPNGWTKRSAARTLPARVRYTGIVSLLPSRYRLAVVSKSPTISSDDVGGTYVPYVETAIADRAVWPALPDTNGLSPIITKPLTGSACYPNGELGVEWMHGAKATTDRVPRYRVDLYPSWCHAHQNAGLFSGLTVFTLGAPEGFCPPLDPVASRGFITSPLAKHSTVAHNGAAPGTLQGVLFSRDDLVGVGSLAESSMLTGYTMVVVGVSGPDPGPAGLIVSDLTLDATRDLPILPADIRIESKFSDAGTIVVDTLMSKNPKSLVNATAYALPENAPAPLGFMGVAHVEADPRVDLYYGGDCSGPSFNTAHGRHLEFSLPSSDDEELTYSAQATQDWRIPSVFSCPVTKSLCVPRTIKNPKYKPSKPTGVVAAQVDADLVAVWSRHPDPNLTRFDVRGYTPSGTDVLFDGTYNNPKTLTVANADENHAVYPTVSSEVQQVAKAAPLDLETIPNDVGKQAVVDVRACTQYKCSDWSSQSDDITIQGNENTPGLPERPTKVSVELAEPTIKLSYDTFNAQQGGGKFPDWGSMMTLFWDPPVAGPAPTYFRITTLAGNAKVADDLLPQLLEQVGVPIDEPPPGQSWSIVVRHDPGDPTRVTVNGSTLYAAYIGHYDSDQVYGPAPLDVTVQSCIGEVPLAGGLSYGFVVDDGATCGTGELVGKTVP